MSTFSERVLQRAYYLWQNTGSEDQMANYYQATLQQVVVEGIGSEPDNRCDDFPPALPPRAREGDRPFWSYK